MTDEATESNKKGLTERFKKLRLIDVLVPLIMLGMVATLAYFDMQKQATAIATNSTRNITEADLNASFLNGAEYGYNVLQARIVMTAFNCSAQPIAVKYGNYTANLVAVECIRVENNSVNSS